MNDPIDMAESAVELYNSGTIRATVRRDLSGGVGKPSACRHCGELPVTMPFKEKSMLVCPRCGRRTSPHSSRQRMIIEWNSLQ